MVGLPTGFDPSAYGRHIAADYDATTGAKDPRAELALLSELAGPGGSVLEFGVGTGRIALPLLERGHRVVGIDGSADMVQRLRTKPRGSAVTVHVGDFATTRAGGTFDLVVLAMNTIYALPSQQAQVDCFANAAAHLHAGGHFVIDAWLPDPGAFRDGRALRLLELRDGSVVLEAAEWSPATQTMRTDKIYLQSDSVRVFPAHHRYAWPAELDLMARLAGLTLAARWSDHDRTPFTDSSRQHVSVWRKT